MFTRRAFQPSTMPATRTTDAQKPATRQLTLTGKPAPAASSNSSSSSSTKKSKIERVYTDAILPIKLEFTELIAARKKNHEYRTYKVRDTVQRIWLYTTGATGAITCVTLLLPPFHEFQLTYITYRRRHVMLTAHPKTPGEVQDPTGVGNDDFDNGLKKSKFGYPVLAFIS